MRRLLAALAALLLLVVGTAVLVAYVHGADNRALAGVRSVDVLVADELIPEGTSGDELAGMVRTETVPAKSAVDGRVEDLEALAGRVATVDLVPGEQLLAGRFARPDELRVPGTVDVPAGKQEISVLLEPQRAVGGRLVAGDTLFLEGCGRTDLPGGDPEQMYFSLTQRLGKVSDDTVLYPGHLYAPDPSATMGETRANNYVFQPKSLDDWMRYFGR